MTLGNSRRILWMDWSGFVFTITQLRGMIYSNVQFVFQMLAEVRCVGLSAARANKKAKKAVDMREVKKLRLILLNITNKSFSKIFALFTYV